MRRRWPAAGGVAGPVAFLIAWAALGAGTEGYDPTRQAISRLAALGAPTRPAMTAALIVLGGGMILFGIALRPDRTWPLPVMNGVATLAVAAFPLGGAYDTAHGVAAAAGYVTLAAIPVAAAHGRRLSLVAGVACGLCLLASVVVARDGLLQRGGLTTGHAWVVVTALALLLGQPSSKRPPRCLARKRSAAA